MFQPSLLCTTPANQARWLLRSAERRTSRVGVAGPVIPKFLVQTATSRPVCAASSAASAMASERTPSSPVAAGVPLPATAS